MQHGEQDRSRKLRKEHCKDVRQTERRKQRKEDRGHIEPKRAGSVKMAPATITPLLAPMDWIMTFSPKAFLRLKALDSPTAMMAIGIAASNTWPTFSPK